MTEGEGLGEEGEEKGDRNVILWADHRAEEEAALINKTGEGVLGFVGGVMSVSTARRGIGCVTTVTIRIAHRYAESLPAHV